VEQALVRGSVREPESRLQPSDWTTYSITAPTDPRLPNGGGYAVTGLHDIAPSLYGQVNYEIQSAGNYGNEYQYRAAWT